MEQGQTDQGEIKTLDLLVSLVRAGAPPDTASADTPPAVISTEEWNALVPLARKHGLGGLLYAALETLAREDVPENVSSALHETYLNTRLVQRLAYEELGSLLDIFARAHVPMVVLKGAALAHTLYPDPALRPFGDLDLLVHQRDLLTASAFLVTRGSTTVSEMNHGADSALWAQQTFFRGGTHPSRVELHTHLFVLPYYRKRTQLAWFWDHIESFQLFKRRAIAFDPTAQLLHLTAHYALHHREVRLIWLYDLALLVHKHGAAIDWRQTMATARVFGLANAVELALREMSAVWQIALPTAAQVQMQSLPDAPYERLMFTLARSPNKQARWLSDGIGAGSAQYWLAHLFPSRAYMQERYSITHPLLTPLYYPARLGAGGGKFVRALVALARDRKSV